MDDGIGDGEPCPEPWQRGARLVRLAGWNIRKAFEMFLEVLSKWFHPRARFYIVE